MPWTYPGNVPDVARNWTEDEQRRCVEAANATLEETGDDEQAIFACIRAAGKDQKMKTKTYRAPMDFKAEGDKGEFTSVFATLNVRDYDNDVTLPGAFGQQEVMIEPWNHNYSQPPVGMGTIHERDNQAVADGQFFMEIENGRDHFAVAKRLGPRQEWSYSFNIIEAEMGTFEEQPVRFLKKLEVIGVGQVTRGAGIDTHTESVKSAKSALPSHSTATTDTAWDGPEMDRRCPSERAPLRASHAWVDPDGDPDVKSSYKFIHHMVSAGGEVGAANIRGCQSGIGVLNGGRGGTTIPDGDHRGVWNHLAKHLRDADVEPPELKSVDGHGQAEGDDGEPRNPPPSVIASQIEILMLEEE